METPRCDFPQRLHCKEFHLVISAFPVQNGLKQGDCFALYERVGVDLCGLDSLIDTDQRRGVNIFAVLAVEDIRYHEEHILR
jgi:hypothetical protein